LFVDDSVEEKVYHRQIFKKFISDQVLSNPSNKKIFEQENMKEFLEIPEALLEREEAFAIKSDGILGVKRPEMIRMGQTNAEISASTDQFSSKFNAYKKRTEKQISKLKSSN